MKLEKIVPPFDLCVLIPENAFQKSALVWVKERSGVKYVLSREVAEFNLMNTIPAPTLEEIILVLPKKDKNENKLSICPMFPESVWTIGYEYLELQRATPNLSEAALRLFLKEAGK